jgi:hypothetical protein
MSDFVSCQECEAIVQELRDAYADAWSFSGQESKDAWVATYKMIGGTEEDATRAEDLAPAAQFREPLRINRAIHRKFAHEARSGHKVPWAPEY